MIWADSISTVLILSPTLRYSDTALQYIVKVVGSTIERDLFVLHVKNFASRDLPGVL